MKTNSKTSGLKIKAGIKCGALGTLNHTRPGIKVKTAVTAGHAPMANNHSAALAQ
jgi:hypothetical protein